MKYSVGDRVKIVEDGWGCCARVGQTGTITELHGNLRTDHTILMDDGAELRGIWEEGFELIRSHESSSAIYLLGQMYEAVKYRPNKDWLDPSLERAVKEFLEEVK